MPVYAPSTTKGDIVVHNGTTEVRLPVGTDAFHLVADSSASEGVAWSSTLGTGAFSADAATQITPITPIVLDEATGNEIALDLAYTVNKATSGNDTGLVLNKTDTLSQGTSLLLDLQVGGASQVTIDDVGQLRLDRAETHGDTTGIAWGDGDTSLFQNSDDVLYLKVAGTDRFYWTTNTYCGRNGGGPAMMNEAASGGNPTLVPDRVSFSSGIGASEPGTVSIINTANETCRFTRGESDGHLRIHNDHGGDGVNHERLEIKAQGTGNDFLIETTAGGTGGVTNIAIDSKVILDPSDTYGTGTGLWFGSTADSGFYESSDNVIRVRTGGADVFQFNFATFQSFADTGPGFYAEVASATNPTILPRRAGNTTGFGSNAAGEISLINSATETARLNLGESNAFLHLYNDSGSTNWERLEITGQTGGNFLIQTAAGGVGDTQDIEIDSQIILDPSLVRDGTTGVMFGDGDTGFYESGSDDELNLIVGGTNLLRFSGNGAMYCHNAAGPRLENAAASATNPTINPNRSSFTTGIGANAAGEISLIIGGQETIRLDSTHKTILNPDGDVGTDSGLWFSDADSGVYEAADDNLYFRIATFDRWFMYGNRWRAANGAGGGLENITGSATAPTVLPNVTASTTGIGANAAGEISLINSATETARLNFGESNAFLHLYNDSGATNWERLEITGQTAGDFKISTTVGAAGTKRELILDAYTTIIGPSYLSPTLQLERTAVGTLGFTFVGTDCRVDCSNNMLFTAASAGKYVFTDVITDATNKSVRMGCSHYTIAEEPVSLIFGFSQSSSNQVNIGGGTASQNAATAIDFYAAANNTTTTGTKVAQFTSTLFDLQPGTEMQMDLTTEDSPFINFKATADADATSAISTLTTSGAVTHHIQIEINGVTAWIPVSTTDPT